MKISIKDVARKARVSTANVSRVLVDFPGVRDKARKKVLKAVREIVMIMPVWNPFFLP